MSASVQYRAVYVKGRGYKWLRVEQNPLELKKRAKSAGASIKRTWHKYTDGKPVMKYVLFGAVGVGVLLVTYGIYQLITSYQSGSNTAGAACASQYQYWSQQYMAQYHAFLTGNNGAALSSQQEAALSLIATQMNTAEQCMVKEYNYNADQWAATATNIILAAAGVALTAVVLSALNRYLVNRGGRITSSSEARSAVRQAEVAGDVQSGELTASDGASAMAENSAVAGADAQAEAASLGSDASVAEADAVAAGDSTLLDSIQSFISDIIDTIISVVTSIYDFFYALIFG